MTISSLPATAGAIEVSIFEVAKTVIHESREHPIRLMTSLYEYKDREPDTIVIREGQPTRMNFLLYTKRLQWHNWTLQNINSGQCRNRFFQIQI